VLTLATVGLAACGDDGAGTGATTSTGTGDGSSGAEGGEKIAIKTHVNIQIPKGGPVPGSSISEGEVLDGSSIGDSPLARAARSAICTQMTRTSDWWTGPFAAPTAEDRLHAGRAAGSDSGRPMEGRERDGLPRGPAGRGSDGDQVRARHGLHGRS
jgi:hypothetical protein